MNNLPIAFEISNSSFDRRMFWYSTNSQPILKKGLTLERPIFGESLNRSVDMHYVWDLNSKDFLMSDGISNVKAVGSILFVKPELLSRDNSEFYLTYFDVTPFENADTYYTTERMCANLSKIVEITSQLSTKKKLKINLLVKPKRVININHSREYIHMLNTYEKNGLLEILKPEVNIYGIASSVDCIIGIPFTSPVVVGREITTPATFIDMHKDDYHLPETHNGFKVISDDIQLMSWLEECLQHHSGHQKYLS
jgi:polysaccharide biosynthesis PFTS motif protein